MALEFLVMTSMIMLIFIIAVLLYVNNMDVGRRIDNKLAATELCFDVSSKISSFAALGGESKTKLLLPPHLNYRNYSVWVVSDDHRITVDYETDEGKKAGASCSLQVTGITNSGGSALFRLDENSTLTNEGGLVHVEP